MFCSISGQQAIHPVVSRRSGKVYEKAVLAAWIAEKGTDPLSGEPVALDSDYIEVDAAATVPPLRDPGLTSIPALLEALQTEFNAIVLESHVLRQHLRRTQEELSSALYRNDAATRVVEKLTAERNEALKAAGLGPAEHPSAKPSPPDTATHTNEALDSTSPKSSSKDLRNQPPEISEETQDIIAEEPVTSIPDALVKLDHARKRGAQSPPPSKRAKAHPTDIISKLEEYHAEAVKSRKADNARLAGVDLDPRLSTDIHESGEHVGVRGDYLLVQQNKQSFFVGKLLSDGSINAGKAHKGVGIWTSGDPKDVAYITSTGKTRKLFRTVRARKPLCDIGMTVFDVVWLPTNVFAIGYPDHVALVDGRIGTISQEVCNDKRGITSFCLHPDMEYLIYATLEAVVFWSLFQKDIVLECPTPSPASSIVASRTGFLVAWICSGSVVVKDLRTDDDPVTLDTEGRYATSVRFDEQTGRLLLATTENEVIKVWEYVSKARELQHKTNLSTPVIASTADWAGDSVVYLTT